MQLHKPLSLVNCKIHNNSGTHSDLSLILKKRRNHKRMMRKMKKLSKANRNKTSVRLMMMLLVKKYIQKRMKILRKIGSTMNLMKIRLKMKRNLRRRTFLIA